MLLRLVTNKKASVVTVHLARIGYTISGFKKANPIRKHWSVSEKDLHYHRASTPAKSNQQTNNATDILKMTASHSHQLNIVINITTFVWVAMKIDIDWYTTVNTSNLACLICIQSELRVYRKSIHLDDQFLDSNWMIFEDNSIFHSSYSLAPSSPRDSSFWTVWEKRMRRRLSADLDSALSENGRVWRQIERRIKTQNRNNTKTINWNSKLIK